MCDDDKLWCLTGVANHVSAKYCYMAKLAIDSASLEYLVINREIFIPNLEVGRFSLFYFKKSGDLPQNRETWKLCDRVDT